MNVPIIPHRRVNKMLCLVLLAMVFSFLLIGGIFSLLGDTDMGLLFCIPAGITACFSLFYGILWGVYARKEQKRQKKLERAAQLLSPTPDHTVTYHEFFLPRQEFIKIAKDRFQKIATCLLICGIVIFVILYSILLLANGFGGIGHLLSVIVFSYVIMIPGILMQYIIFCKYARTVPERIMLFPEKIIIDGEQYCTYEIKKLLASSFSSASKDTSVLYRKLIVTTLDETREYTIDYRFASDDVPRWNQYGEFLTELRIWAEQNNVQLTVDYMN